eukprot:6205435-Prymnesium_polylepis.1
MRSQAKCMRSTMSFLSSVSLLLRVGQSTSFHPDRVAVDVPLNNTPLVLELGPYGVGDLGAPAVARDLYVLVVPKHADVSVVGERHSSPLPWDQDRRILQAGWVRRLGWARLLYSHPMSVYSRHVSVSLALPL